MCRKAQSAWRKGHSAKGREQGAGGEGQKEFSRWGGDGALG